MAWRSWLPAGILTVIPLSAACTVELLPGVVVGNDSVNGAVKLAVPAPATGIVITLSSSTSSAQVPSQVTVRPGESTAGFAVTTSAVSAGTNGVITAAGEACAAAAGITVHPPAISGFTLSDNNSRANACLTGNVTLNGPAPLNGATVELRSSDLLVRVPAFVTIPAGETSAQFALATGQSLSRSSVAVTATYGASVQTALLSVLPGI
jgi:hypothetical protein